MTDSANREVPNQRVDNILTSRPYHAEEFHLRISLTPVRVMSSMSGQKRKRSESEPLRLQHLGSDGERNVIAQLDAAVTLTVTKSRRVSGGGDEEDELMTTRTVATPLTVTKSRRVSGGGDEEDELLTTRTLATPAASTPHVSRQSQLHHHYETRQSPFCQHHFLQSPYSHHYQTRLPMLCNVVSAQQPSPPKTSGLRIDGIRKDIWPHTASKSSAVSVVTVKKEPVYSRRIRFESTVMSPGAPVSRQLKLQQPIGMKSSLTSTNKITKSLNNDQFRKVVEVYVPATKKDDRKRLLYVAVVVISFLTMSVALLSVLLLLPTPKATISNAIYSNSDSEFNARNIIGKPDRIQSSGGCDGNYLRGGSCSNAVHADAERKLSMELESDSTDKIDSFKAISDTVIEVEVDIAAYSDVESSPSTTVITDDEYDAIPVETPFSMSLSAEPQQADDLDVFLTEEPVHPPGRHVAMGKVTKLKPYFDPAMFELEPEVIEEEIEVIKQSALQPNVFIDSLDLNFFNHDYEEELLLNSDIEGVSLDHLYGLDYAVWPRGGRVVTPGQTTATGTKTVLTSSPHVLSQGRLKRLQYRFHLHRDEADAKVLIAQDKSVRTVRTKDSNSNNELSQVRKCFAFSGSSGVATVVMHSPVIVGAIQIAHYNLPDVMSQLEAKVESGSGFGPGSGSIETDTDTNSSGQVVVNTENSDLNTNPSPNSISLSTAPRQIQLTGWLSDPTTDSRAISIDLGTHEYLHAEDSVELQTFPMHLDGGKVALKALTVSVLSNYGREYTRLCRIKVLGALAL